MKRILSSLISISILLLSSFSFGGDFSEAEKVRLSDEVTRSPQNRYRVDSQVLLGLLKEGEFTSLKAKMVDTEKKFGNNPAYEWAYIKCYEDFDTMSEVPYEKMLSLLNNWVELDKSYVSVAARGFYIAGEAQRYRGTRYTKQTSENKLSKSIELRMLAVGDLEESIRLNPKLLPAYSELIKSYRHLGNREAAEQFFLEAIQHIPETYYIRQSAIMFEQPRWGGSFKKAQEIINKAQEYGEINHRLWNLRGNVFEMKGHNCRKDPNCAIGYFNKALEYGEKISWITDLAYYYYKEGDYNSSEQTISKMTPYSKNGKVYLLSSQLAQLDQVSQTPIMLRGPALSSSSKPSRKLRYSDFSNGW